MTCFSIDLGDENWEADWGWNEDANESAETVESTDLPDNGKQKWFQECILSLSPTNDMVAIAHEDKIVVLARKFLILFVTQLFYEYMI